MKAIKYGLVILLLSFSYYCKAQASPISGTKLIFAYSYQSLNGLEPWENTKKKNVFDMGFAHGMPLGNPNKDQLLNKFELYLRVQVGATNLSFTNSKFEPFNRDSLGLAYRLSKHNRIWVQEEYSKVEGNAWYTSTSLGYDYALKKRDK
jgi:hypothetical protein